MHNLLKLRFMAKLTRHNYKKFTRRNLLPNADGSKPNSEQAQALFVQNRELLDRFHRYYDSLQSLRQNRARCVRYYFGDQLSDLIDNPDGCGQITEEEYMRKQGITPMSMNIIRKTGKAIVGVYRQSKLEPIAIARDRDEQKLGEMMSIALEYVYQNLHLNEINARGYEETLLSAIPCFRVGYDWDDERKLSDVTVSLCDINRMAWDDNTSGLYFSNISCIGYLHDMTIGQVLSRFAHSRQQKERIIEIYKHCQSLYGNQNQQFQKDERKRNISFNIPLNPDQCRVIEIWSKEQYDSYVCHDTARGQYYTVPIEDEEGIIAENQRRQMEMLSVGGDVEDAALIEYEYKVEEKWTVRYLTPDGYVLHQSETPYWHGSHPFTIGAYPLVDGEIHSFVDDTINVQRVFNVTFMRQIYLRMNQAKGFGLVNRKILERSGISETEFASKFTSPSAIMSLEWDAGESEDLFKQYNESSSNGADSQIMQQCMELMNEITGAHGAMRGEKAGSNTPAALYAQETENANNNINDLQEWYNGLICNRDYKIMMVIQQYYKDKRFINIAGKDYSEESKWYDPEKVRNSQFDIALVESSSSGIMRLQNEQLLQNLLSGGVIDPITYLECSASPFADKVLERIKARQSEAQEQQQTILAQQQAAENM